MHLFLTILGWIGAYYAVGFACMVATMFMTPKGSDAVEGAGVAVLFVALLWPIAFPLVIAFRFWPDATERFVDRRIAASMEERPARSGATGRKPLG